MGGNSNQRKSHSLNSIGNNFR